MKLVMNMPGVEKTTNANNQATQSVFYKPLPDKAGQKVTNEVFISLYRPDKWKIFNLDEDTRKRFGLYDYNPLTASNLDTIYTFFFNVPLHYVKNYLRPDGSVSTISMLCPIKFNKYLMNDMGRKPLFREPRCAYCELEQAYWAKYNDRWSELAEITGVEKAKLTKEGYKELSEKDVILKKSKAKAKEYKSSERCLLNVFDYDKYTGSRPLDENESLQYKLWFSPPKVLAALCEYHIKDTKPNKHGIKTEPFYSFSNPNGFQLMEVIKDTTECVGTNLMRTTYQVMKGSVVPIDQDWVDYLCDLDNAVDPSDFLVILPYDEAKMYAQKELENDSAQDMVSAQPQVQVPAQVAAVPSPPKPKSRPAPKMTMPVPSVDTNIAVSAYIPTVSAPAPSIPSAPNFSSICPKIPSIDDNLPDRGQEEGNDDVPW
jgi:hypothetical protein